MSSKDFRQFRTNSTGDRLARLSVPKARQYMKLRDEGKGIEEALDIVAPIDKKVDRSEQLVLNTNDKKDEDPW